MIAQATLAPPAPSPAVRLETVEALLRARRLDNTLTSNRPDMPPDAGMPLDVEPLDTRLTGGLPRGQLSEIVGPVSSGRTSLAWAWLGAATRRGESAALVDTFDRFDPASAEACGILLPHLLWVRGQALSKTAGAVDAAWRPGVRTAQGPGTLLERTIERALKALNLVVQSGVCTAVVLDLADVPVSTLGRIPASTWLRVQRILEGGDTACVVLAPAPVARSAGGITMRLGASGPAGADGARAVHKADGARATYNAEGARAAHTAMNARAACGAGTPGGARWRQGHDRSRRLEGLSVSARLMSPRRRVAGTVALDADMPPAV